MRLYYPNLSDSATISASSQASTSLAGENVAHDHRARIWRTGTSSADEYVTIDLGSSQAATAAIIFAHTLLNADSDIELRKSNDNFVSNDVLVATFTWSASAMLVTFSSTSSRYWRFAFTKASAGVSRDLGRVFLGNYVELADLPDWDGFEVTPIDLSQKQRSEGGQSFTAIRNHYREFRLPMSGVTQSEIDALKTFSETVATHTPFFFTGDVGQSDETGEIIYAQLMKPLKRTPDGMGPTSGLAWSTSFEAEEML